MIIAETELKLMVGWRDMIFTILFMAKRDNGVKNEAMTSSKMLNINLLREL
jgi:hypothetical protein